MTPTEAMIQQLKNLKGKPLQQKLKYIYTYFGGPIIAALLFLTVGIVLIVQMVTAKDTALNVACLNAYPDNDKAASFCNEFAERAQIDLNKCEVIISTNLFISESDLTTSFESVEIIMAQLASQSMDAMISDIGTLSQYFYQEIFCDLTEVLSPEQLACYGEYFLYADMAVLHQIQVPETEVLKYPDPTKPELMQEPVPIALRLPVNSTFVELYYGYSKEQVGIGIVINSQNLSNVLAFIDHIME